MTWYMQKFTLDGVPSLEKNEDQVKIALFVSFDVLLKIPECRGENISIYFF